MLSPSAAVLANSGTGASMSSTLSSMIGQGASALGSMSGLFGEVFNGLTGYGNYLNQKNANAFNQKSWLYSMWLNDQYRNQDIARSERILAENRAREDNAWQRAVADIQKAGLSTTMLSGGAPVGATTTNVGAQSASPIHLTGAEFKSGANFGAILDMYNQFLQSEETKERTRLLKAQKSNQITKNEIDRYNFDLSRALGIRDQDRSSWNDLGLMLGGLGRTLIDKYDLGNIAIDSVLGGAKSIDSKIDNTAKKLYSSGHKILPFLMSAGKFVAGRTLVGRLGGFIHGTGQAIRNRSSRSGSSRSNFKRSLFN